MRSLRTKLLLSYLCVVLITLAVVGSLSALLVENFYIRTVRAELEARGHRLANVIFMEHRFIDAEQRANAVFFSRSLLDTAFWIVDEGGRIVGTSSGYQDLLGRSLTQNDWQRLQANQRIEIRGAHPLTGSRVLGVGLPVTRGGRVQGAVVLFAPLSGIADTMSQLRTYLLQAALLGAFVAFLISSYLARRMSYPLKQMTAITCQMLEGDFSQRVSDIPDDEIGELATHFNLLGERLAQSITDLTEGQERLQSLVSTMAEGVILTDSVDNLVVINPAARRLLDLGEAETRLPDDHPLQQALVEQRKSEESLAQRVEFGPYSLLLKLTPLTAKQPHSGGAVCVISDVSEWHKGEQMRRAFVANVSHELKSPLTLINGYIDALLDGIVKDPIKQQEYLSIIKAETKRLDRLGQDLLELATIESGHFELQYEELAIERFMGDCLLPWRQLAQETGHVLEAAGSGDGQVSLDPFRVRQILDNLLSNAFRYSDPPATVRVEWQVTDAELRVRVWDEGVGIAPEQLSQIWERFYRVDKARSTHTGGSGLGLSIAKQLAERMGGNLDVASKLGKGSCFILYLPRDTELRVR